LSKAVQPAPSAPELQQRMQDQGVALKYTPPSKFAPALEQEFRVWGKALEMAKVKFD
jgi:tripartite-type tricarboxylate transporter receptor subunit TctC